MRCLHCHYPVFKYSRCCPMCGQSVEMEIDSRSEFSGPQTRIGFWLKHVIRSLGFSKFRGFRSV
jgi:hypothetical protein